MLRQSSGREGSLPLSTATAANERRAHSKKRLQRILQRGQLFLCLSFALMTFTINIIFFAQLNSSGRNDISANVSDAPILERSDAPILTAEVARRNELKMMRRRKQRKNNKGIQRTLLYNSTRYHHHYNDGYPLNVDISSQQEPRGRRKRKEYTSNEQQSNDNGKRMQSSSSSQYYPKAACIHPNGCDDIDLFPSLSRHSEDSIPVIRKKDNYYENYDDDYDDTPIDNGETKSSCRESRSIESQTTTHPTCNDIHSMGFDDQMFQKEDYSSWGESIDLLAVGGANSVWKTTSTHHNGGEHAILKTMKNMNRFDKDRLDLYALDAMVAGAEGNPQLLELLQDETAISQASTTTSSSWNHIMPIYSHCYIATIAPVASGTLKEYVETYPQQHNGQTIHPMEKLRLALQVARGLYQMQMYRYGKPTFAHLDLNPSQFLLFHPQFQPYHQLSGGGGQQYSNMPILQINDFNRGRFLHWDNYNNTCSFQLQGCDKNTRGSRWHAPDRFIGCTDVNERIDTFALGGIFFFLLSDGEAPFYNTRDYEDLIKEGQMPWVPKEALVAAGDHPAFEVLSEMVVRCRALRIEDRPSSLEVVRMLEAKLRNIPSRFWEGYFASDGL